MKDSQSPFDVNRRKFLKLSGLATISGLLAACDVTGQDMVAGATPTHAPAPTPTPSPTPKPTLTNADWSQLADKLQGSLVRPGNAQYATARQLFSPRFDNVQPQAVIYCASPADVQTCLTFAQRFELPVAPRTGGHSFAGYSTSTGMILDVTRMNTISVDADAGTASIGAGTHLIDVYSALAQHGVVVPAGSCPTVGIAGLALGGGTGVLGRKFGLTCDNLLSAQLVTADGRVLTCDETNNPDLFWALRGGGGGNFGIATSFTFRTYPVSSVALFTLQWPWKNAADVVNAWQHWAPQAPDEIWSNCVLTTTSNKSADPVVQVNGVYVGDVASLNAVLEQLNSSISVAPSSSYVAPSSLLDAMLYEAGCSGKSVAACHLPTQNSQGTVLRDASSVKSDYFTKILSGQAINVLVTAIEQRQTSPILGNGGIGMDAYGGIINRIAADATAFVHRKALFSAQYSGSWNAGDSDTVVAANQNWLNTTWQAMRPYASGEAYQNYVDPDLQNWQHAYYGANLARLQKVKASYDPQNFFHFGQSIPLH